MISRELGIFLIVGACTVLVDFGCYRGLLHTDLLPLDVAKAAGFFVGTLCAYFANRFWTFGNAQHEAGSGWRFIVLYGCTLAANVSINALALILLKGFSFAIESAFVLATGVSATLNFLGMKFFVFRTKAAADRASDD